MQAVSAITTAVVPMCPKSPKQKQLVMQLIHCCITCMKHKVRKCHTTLAREALQYRIQHCCELL